MELSCPTHKLPWCLVYQKTIYFVWVLFDFLVHKNWLKMKVGVNFTLLGLT